MWIFLGLIVIIGIIVFNVYSSGENVEQRREELKSKLETNGQRAWFEFIKECLESGGYKIVIFDNYHSNGAGETSGISMRMCIEKNGEKLGYLHRNLHAELYRDQETHLMLARHSRYVWQQGGTFAIGPESGSKVDPPDWFVAVRNYYWYDE